MMLHICDGRNKSKLTGVSPQDIQPNAVDLNSIKYFVSRIKSS